MARSGNGSPNTNPNPNAGSPPAAAPPPPPSSAPTGPTGTAGFSVGESSIATLQKHASDLESGYEGISSQLQSQQLAFNALGMFGTPMTAAVNSSNSNSVDKAKQAAATMGKVNDGLKATQETNTKTDQFIADQFGKIVPDSGAKNPSGSPDIAPTTQAPAGPEVAPVEDIPGGPTTTPPAQQGPAGPEVSKFDPVPGGPTTQPQAQQGPGGPEVSSFVPPPGASTTLPPVSQGPAGPPVAPVTPPPGNADTTAAAATAIPPPVAPPIAQPPNVPGTPGGMPPVAPPPIGAMPPIGSVPQVPGMPGGKSPATPPVTTDTTVTATWPPAGPRPGGVPYVPGAAGPAMGTFTPTPPAVDSLGPIAANNPPATPRPPVAPNPYTPPKPMPRPSPAVDSLRPVADANPPAAPRPVTPSTVPHTSADLLGPGGAKVEPASPVATGPSPDSPPKGTFTPPPGANPLGAIADANPPGQAPKPDPVATPTPPSGASGLLDPKGYPGGDNLPNQSGPKGEPAPPALTPVLDPALATLPPEVAQVMAPPNILDLLDPNGYPGNENVDSATGPKADGAWPATTIDGKPWSDLQSLTPEQSQKWIDNLRNILSTKDDGAFFWSGSVYDSDGNRVSVMTEAENMAKADGRTTLEGTLDDKGIKLPSWGNTSPEGKAVWDSVSASLAHGSSGDVYVLLGPDRRPDNVFHMTEFPILKDNPSVNRVIAIDVQSKEETVVFTRP